MEEHITLFEEEMQSLELGKEICIYENEDKDITIYLKQGTNKGCGKKEFERVEEDVWNICGENGFLCDECKESLNADGK